MATGDLLTVTVVMEMETTREGLLVIVEIMVRLVIMVVRNTTRVMVTGVHPATAVIMDHRDGMKEMMVTMEDVAHRVMVVITDHKDGMMETLVTMEDAAHPAIVVIMDHRDGMRVMKIMEEEDLHAAAIMDHKDGTKETMAIMEVEGLPVIMVRDLPVVTAVIMTTRTPITADEAHLATRVIRARADRGGKTREAPLHNDADQTRIAGMKIMGQPVAVRHVAQVIAAVTELRADAAIPGQQPTGVVVPRVLPAPVKKQAAAPKEAPQKNLPVKGGC
jgi:hypothetical protein